MSDGTPIPQARSTTPRRAWKFSDSVLHLEGGVTQEARRGSDYGQALMAMPPAPRFRFYAEPVGMNVSISDDNAHATPKAGVTTTRPLTILVADDEAQLLSVARRVLEHAGFTVVTALDGEEALGLIRARKGAFDVVLSDILMPNMDGIELAVRARSEFPFLRFVFMTGVADISKDREQSADICEAIVSKPFDVVDLVEILRQAAAAE